VNRRKGFSLTELLTTIVILAVLASVAIPGFGRSRDKAAFNQGIAYLRVIRTGAQMYHARNGTYLDTTNCGGATCANAAAIRAAFGTEITTDNFTFTITNMAAGTFTANAIRNPAATSPYTVSLTQAGAFSTSAGALPAGCTLPAN
jgi:prepilin-type N-terminal cleavage/methylation domain-containing protein